MGRARSRRWATSRLWGFEPPRRWPFSPLVLIPVGVIIVLWVLGPVLT